MKRIAFIPYGRERTVSILFPYLHRAQQSGQIDELWLCMNTDPDQHSDRAYAYTLAQEHGWVHTLERPVHNVLHPKQLNTGTFYRYMTDPDAVYIRFDDDIVYVHEETIPRLVSYARDRDEILTTFPIIWNNAVVSWHLQQLEIIPREWGSIDMPYCMSHLAWADPYFAERMHRLLIERIEADAVDSCFMHMDVQLAPRQQFSVSCFAVSGRDYAKLDPPGVLDFPEEEHWHTVHRPGLTGQVNVILSNALVSHFSFYPQHRYLFEHTDLLNQYRELSLKVAASL